jgi:choline dehydrogenase
MQEIGIPYTPELNNGSNVGAKRETLTADGFRRVSSYDAYYLPVENRTNLHVATQSQVQSIILENDGAVNGSLIARGVVFNDIASGRTLNVTANNEVILSAGAFHTPQIMMLSVGPSLSLLLIDWMVKIPGFSLSL